MAPNPHYLKGKKDPTIFNVTIEKAYYSFKIYYGGQLERLKTSERAYFHRKRPNKYSSQFRE